MATTRPRKKAAAAPADPRETASPLDESLPKQTPSLPGQQVLPGVDAKDKKPREPKKVVVRPGLVEFLHQFDVEAFLDDWPPKEMRRRIDAQYGTARVTRVTRAEFELAAPQAFGHWRQRLHPESQISMLNGEQWNKVKYRVTKILDQMHGRTLRQCVRVARVVVSCNEHILRGLPKRFHVWSQ